MEKIRVIINRESNTLDVWFDDAKKEFICEEAGDEVILKKDKNNRIIGFEKLNLLRNYSAILKAGCRWRKSAYLCLW